MTALTLQERAKRLAEYSQTIAGDGPLESVYSDFSQDTVGLESVPQIRLQKAADAVKRSTEGVELTADDLVAAEAIIHRTKRPSHLIQNGWFESFTGDFRYLTEDKTVSYRLRAAIPSVGRIDLLQRPTTYGGTGFIVGKNLVMTNRHVAEIFTTGVGVQNVTIKPWDPGAIDLKREWGDAGTNGFNLTKCLMIHPYWDMALFQADLPNSIDPLQISIVPYHEQLGNDVVVIGYPAFDPDRNDVDVQQEIFEGKYNVKRIAPGRVARRKRSIRSSWLQQPVEALAHDSSTLGGNSGSAVLDVRTGHVAALHFAGRYMIENYGVPGHELARDRRVVDAGVNFVSLPPSENTDLEPFWHAADPSQWESGPVSSTLASSASPPAVATGGSVSMEVPLRITVSLGNPGDVTVTGVGAGPTPTRTPDDRDDTSERQDSGYDQHFLSESVPTPALSAEAREDAFNLDGSHLLDYTHFSVCQSKSRTLPRFVAWNIDGGNLKSLSRRGIDFRRDNRVPERFQAGNELYRNNPLDRGHVARRVDVNWGPLPEARQANKDSFFFTNITPQHQSFNQSSRHGLWGELENAILEDIEVENLKVSVMAGPIFQTDDPRHRGVRIPRDFWKLIAFRDTSDSEFKVAAYILSQKELVPTEALELDRFNLYQVSLNKLSNEMNDSLKFDDLLGFDTFSSAHESVSGSGVREIGGRDDILRH